MSNNYVLDKLIEHRNNILRSIGHAKESIADHEAEVMKSRNSLKFMQAQIEMYEERIDALTHYDDELDDE